MSWQPIETAPKDKVVLLLFPAGTVASGKQRYGQLGEPNQDEYRWRCECCGRYGNPTHWMPIPEPPK